MNKVPVGQTIAYAYSFTFGHLGAVIGLTWLPLVVSGVANYILAEVTYANVLADQAALAGNPVQTDAATRLGQLALTVGVWFVMVFIGAVVAVAMVRLALGLRTAGGPVHFAVGRDEWRMFGGHLRWVFAAIAVIVILYLGLLILGVVAAIVVGAVAKSAPASGLIAILAVGGVFALFGAGIYTMVRMGFFLSPSIVAERGGGIKRSYDLTRGNFWRIVLVWLAVGLPLVLLFGIAEYVLLWRNLSFDWGHLPTDPQAAALELTKRINAAMVSLQGELVRQNLPLQIVTLVYGILAAGLQYSAASFAYRALVPASTTAN